MNRRLTLLLLLSAGCATSSAPKPLPDSSGTAMSPAKVEAKVELPLVGAPGHDPWGVSTQEPDHAYFTRLLRERRFTELDALLNRLADIAEAEPVEKAHWLVQTLNTLVHAPDRMESGEAWVAHSPSGFGGYYLRGWAFIDRAWEARGQKLARSTTDAQWAGMHAALDRAEADYRKSIALRPTPVQQIGLMHVAQLGGDLGKTIDEAVAAYPRVLVLRTYAMGLYTEKWGGGEAWQERFAAEADLSLNRKFAVVKAFPALARCRTLGSERRWAEALSECEKSTTIARNWDGLLEHAEVLETLGRRDEAAPLVFEAYRMRPQRPDVRIRYAQALNGTRKPEEAAAVLIDLRSSVESEDDLPREFKGAASWVAETLALDSAWNSAKPLEERRRRVDLALKVDPRSARGLMARGLVREKAGDPVGAEADLRAALRESPQDPSVLFPLLDFLVRAKREAEALAVVEARLRVRPDPSLRSRRAQLLKALGRIDEAKKEAAAACAEKDELACRLFTEPQRR